MSAATRPPRAASDAYEARILSVVTEHDRGLVERPTLTPHLDAHPVSDQQVLVASESFATLLRGQRYVDLLPLLDGSRDRREIVEALAGSYPALEVQTALVALAYKGYLVSSEFSIDRGAAAFWSALGASPRFAEERLGSARLRLEGGGRRLAANLKETGLSAVRNDPTLIVVATEDYLDPAHAETNRRRLTSGIPWVLVKPAGMLRLAGPVFRPGEDGPCWACLSHRLARNRDVDSFLRTGAATAAPGLCRVRLGPLEETMASLAATEIAKWVVFRETSLLHRSVVSLDAAGEPYQPHLAMRRPQCHACGDEALHRPDRAPAAIELRPSPKPVRNSGGLRSVSPQETLHRYRHLVSPITGAVREVVRVSGATDPWMQVYTAGGNLALPNDRVDILRNGLRTKSAGKGSSAGQAEASALCEALERYSGVFHGDEIRRRGRFETFAEDEAIHPNAVQLYSDRQYARAAEINARGARFDQVPPRFDPSAEIDWSPVWSLTRGRHRLLPTSMLYYSQALAGPVYCAPDSNGCAAGNSFEEAILQGFFELVERDAFACWWYNRVRVPEVDLYSFDNAYLSSTRDYYAKFDRDVWLLDATHDFGIPVFVSVSRRHDKQAEDIVFAAGAHADPEIAALRAVCELNQHLTAVRDVGTDGGGYRYDDPDMYRWWRNVTIRDAPYLAPRPGVRPSRAGDFTWPETADLLGDVELCRTIVEDKGLEFLVLDQTRPDIGLPVAKVIVPGMRHFWSRLGPGRLYDVPVELGWLAEPNAEAELNPVAVFI